MFSKILTAVDNSEHADKAVSLACDIAQKYAAKLVFIHVIENTRLDPELIHMAEVEHLVEPQPAAAGSTLSAAENIDTQSEASKTAAMHRAQQALAERYLDQIERRARQQGVTDIAKIIDEGDPVQCILTAIKRETPDLIMLGSRGLSDFKGLLLGSVSHKVCQLAPCTCITVK